MNSAQLLICVQNGSRTHVDLFQELVQDAKQLIQVRKARSLEAQRSCYMEQNTKWTSAIKRAGGGLDPNEFSNWAKSQPHLREMFGAPAPSLKQVNNQNRLLGLAMLGHAYQEAEERHQRQLVETAENYVKSYHHFTVELAQRTDIADELDIPEAAASCAMAEMIHVTHVAVIDAVTYAEYCKLLEAVYKEARTKQPEIPACDIRGIQSLFFQFHTPYLRKVLPESEYTRIKSSLTIV